MEMDYVNGLIKTATREDAERDREGEREGEAAKREKQLNELRWGYRQRHNE